MKKLSYILFSIFVLITIGCQDEVIPVTVPNAEQYVVEGVIEAGENTGPSYVIISKSVPFFSEINPNQFASLFINNAEVAVSDGSKIVNFTKLCLSNIPPELQETAGELVGINVDSTDVDLCIYIDLNDELNRTFGGTYDLKIRIEDDELFSTTTIPELVELSNFVFKDTPGESIDTMAQLFCTINDPEVTNYYRYFTAAEGSGLIPPFSSITDDVQFNGQEFEFPISKAELPTADFDDSYGLFEIGDTVQIKWTTLDQAHFEFWNTFEYARNNQGPFSSYTRIKSNVDGGFGVWGGYAVQFINLIVEK